MMDDSEAKILKYAPRIAVLAGKPGDDNLYLTVKANKAPLGDTAVLDEARAPNLSFLLNKAIDRSVLVPMGTFTTEHAFSRPDQFKGSLGEIIAQLPESVLAQATAISLTPAKPGFTAGRKKHTAEITVYSGEVKELHTVPLDFSAIHAAAYEHAQRVSKIPQDGYIETALMAVTSLKMLQQKGVTVSDDDLSIARKSAQFVIAQALGLAGAGFSFNSQVNGFLDAYNEHVDRALGTPRPKVAQL